MVKTGVKRFTTFVQTLFPLRRFTFGLNGPVTKQRGDPLLPSGEGSIHTFVSWFTRPTVPMMYSNGHYGYVDGSSARRKW